MTALRRYVETIVALAQREPIRTFAVLRSLGAAVIAFYPGAVSPAQQAAILLFFSAWFGVDETIRHNTTPLSAPKVPEGTPVTVTNPDPAVPDRVVVAENAGTPVPAIPPTYDAAGRMRP